MKNTATEKSFVAKKTITILTPVSNVWEALTNPDLIKQYFFGTDTVTTWKKGSSIAFRGVWEGKPYEDKGTILDIEPGKFVRYSYWSSFSGKADTPENYAHVSYAVIPVSGGTELTILQDGIDTPEARDHSESNWGMILDNLKKMVEK